MPPPYTSNDSLKRRVASVLQANDPSTLPMQWDAIIGAANLQGSNDILQRLLKKNFTIAQVEAWDQLRAYAENQGLFWALVNSGVVNSQVPQDLVKVWDHREELDKYDAGFLTSNGTILYPLTGGSPVGGIVSGTNVHMERLLRQNRCGVFPYGS